MYVFVNRKTKIVEGFDINPKWFLLRLQTPMCLKLVKLNDINSPQTIGEPWKDR